jgi:hypothetical protein
MPHCAAELEGCGMQDGADISILKSDDSKKITSHVSSLCMAVE